MENYELINFTKYGRIGASEWKGNPTDRQVQQAIKILGWEKDNLILASPRRDVIYRIVDGTRQKFADEEVANLKYKIQRFYT